MQILCKNCSFIYVSLLLHIEFVLLSNWQLKLIVPTTKLPWFLPLIGSAAPGTHNHAAMHLPRPTLRKIKGIWWALCTKDCDLGLIHYSYAGDDFFIAFKFDLNWQCNSYCVFKNKPANSLSFYMTHWSKYFRKHIICHTIFIQT